MAHITDERPHGDDSDAFLPLGCIICGAAVGDVDSLDALCAAHEAAFTQLARHVSYGFVTDWPDCAHVATHGELMCEDFTPTAPDWRAELPALLDALGVGWD